jgi:hypothetical protein
VTGNAALLAAKELRQHILANLAVRWNTEPDEIRFNASGAWTDSPEVLDAAHAHSMPWKEIAALMDASPAGDPSAAYIMPQDQPARWSGSHSLCLLFQRAGGRD